MIQTHVFTFTTPAIRLFCKTGPKRASNRQKKKARKHNPVVESFGQVRQNYPRPNSFRNQGVSSSQRGDGLHAVSTKRLYRTVCSLDLGLLISRTAYLELV